MTDRFECYDLIFLDGFIKDTLTNENIVEPIKLIYLLNELSEDNQQYKILVKSLKEENHKLKLRLKDLGVEYF